MDDAEGSEANDSDVRETVSAASRLTDDLVLEILSRLPARSLHRFRCVSRHWRSLICDPEYRARMTQTLAGFMYMYAGRSRYVDTKGGSLHFTSARASPGGGEATAAPPLIDPSALSFPPGFHQRLLQCCKGLLLFCSWAPCPPSTRGAFNYTVCNPATDEWTTVPGLDRAAGGCTAARLAFDPSCPSSSSAYRIFQFENDGSRSSRTRPRVTLSHKVWIYSSETGAWTRRECRWADGAGVVLREETSSVFFRGKLHLCPAKPVIVSVDRDGERWWTSPKPADPRDDGFIGGAPPGFIGVSQGRLLFLNKPEYNYDTCICVWERRNGLWEPRRSIYLNKVFAGWDDHHEFVLMCSVVGMHPDRSMVYFLEENDGRLVSYAMDDVEGQGETICELGYKKYYLPFLPYVPVFVRSLTGTG